MTESPTVFSVETIVYDSTAPEDAGKDVVLWAPILGIYYSARVAVEQRYGLEIVEGDLLFFAADGSPLEANFSEQPYINNEKNTFFPGVYVLKAGKGKNMVTLLAEKIAANLSPHARIFVRTPMSDESAMNFGWPNVQTMMDGIREALKILPAELARRIIFENSLGAFKA